MRKVLNLKSENKISILVAVSGRSISFTESNVLTNLIKYSEGPSINLDVHLSKQIRDELNITQSSFNTSIARLQEKNCIKKEGKTITFHPLFHNLNDTTEILIKLL